MAFIASHLVLCLFTDTFTYTYIVHTGLEASREKITPILILQA
jgi:hypothetical protein